MPLPSPGEPLTAILQSYTKEHSAEYQAQALIDIGFALHAAAARSRRIAEVVIRTSHHTHNVIGSGANDPQKMDPDASRETLDHSAMYILAVAWEDGAWHHVDSYTSERAHRASTVRLWHRIRTEEAAEWTAAYHDPDPSRKKFGAEVVVIMNDGSQDRRTPRQSERPLVRRPPLPARGVRAQAAHPHRRPRGRGGDRPLSRPRGQARRALRREVRELNLVLPPERLLDAEAQGRVGIL